MMVADTTTTVTTRIAHHHLKSLLDTGYKRKTIPIVIIILIWTLSLQKVDSFTPLPASTSGGSPVPCSRQVPPSNHPHSYFFHACNSIQQRHDNIRHQNQRLHHTSLQMHFFDLSSASISMNTIHDAITSFSSSFSHSLLVDGAHSFTQSTTSTGVVEGSLGRDIFTFLVASVVVVPLCKSLDIPPVLGFLLVGCAIGPYGMQMFSNTEADIQLGDFGIIFLLFNEGLSLSPERIKELGKFTGLGVFQLLISIGCLFLGSVLLGPILIRYIQEIGLPLDLRILKPIFENPVKAFVIASAGALSSSAFVLPFLKQRDWEERPEGIAGLSILLLQDLAVAPLLVVLPVLAGSGPQSAAELSVLVFKATVGFGAVLAAGSYLIRYVFDVVAAARSTETFVAAALLVAVGMGQAADILGLSGSTGAFAAGVLLAGNKYRAQIQADIKPFEGILLGIFFMTAGASLDPAVVLQEWPTLLAGIFVFIAVKAGIIFAAGPALGLTRGQAARVALTLAGGGEFAFVLFQLAEDLGVLPTSLAKILVASVIISMSLTPVLGEVGSYAANIIESKGIRSDGLTLMEEIELFDKIDVNRSGTIDFDELRDALVTLDFSYASIAEIFTSFDTNGDGQICRDEWRVGAQSGILAEACERGNSNSFSVLDTTCFTADAVIIVGFSEVGQELHSMLKMSGAKNQRSCSNVVCFDLNPSRVLMGTMNGTPVVFGDGARMELLKAAGVKRPRAAIVTYASDERRLDATMRLRATLPEGTPIYVYEGKSRIGQQLLEAGATEVISDAVETCLRFASLLGACETPDQMSQLRRLSMDSVAMKPVKGLGVSEIPGLSEQAILDLYEEIGCTRSDIDDLHKQFVSLAGENDTIPISALKEFLMRQSSEGPTDGADFESCLRLQDEDGGGMITFTEYLRATWSTECKQL